MIMPTNRPPLAGVRVIESSLLGPGAIGAHLADLGAEVIKVESPSGDYIRQMTWPIIEGTSLLHLHVNRGKRSVALDLRKPEGVQIYRDLAKDADVVIEAMRPGALAKRGLGYQELRALNPRIVFCNLSGYGMTGPYKDLPSHGIAFDTWGGIISPAYDEEGFCYIPEHASIGMHAGPLFGVLGILAAVIRARESGEGCMLEIAQSDAAAYMDWYRSESWKAYERPESEVTGNKGESFLKTLTAAQRKLITDLVDLQRKDLQEIVTTRRAISVESRRFMKQKSVDEKKVLALARRYGEVDGQLSYHYAMNFARVGKTLSDEQKQALMKLRNLDDYPCKGAYVYSRPIRMPKIRNTDWLFGVSK